MTIGLEIVQNEAVSGIFDMNVGNNINKFRIRSLYSREAVLGLEILGVEFFVLMPILLK